MFLVHLLSPNGGTGHVQFRVKAIPRGTGFFFFRLVSRNTVLSREAKSKTASFELNRRKLGLKLLHVISGQGVRRIAQA
jgi:hypothetical protein